MCWETDRIDDRLHIDSYLQPTLDRLYAHHEQRLQERCDEEGCGAVFVALKIDLWSLFWMDP